MRDLQHDRDYQEMARLVNFDQSNTAIGEPDNFDETIHHPEDAPSPRRFSQMGSTKLLFVTGGVSGVALLVGVITNQLFRPITVTSPNTTGLSYEAKEELTLSLEPPTENRNELGELRTEVALKDQAQELEDMNGEVSVNPDEQSTAKNIDTNQTETEPASKPSSPSSTTTATTPSPQPAPQPVTRITPTTSSIQPSAPTQPRLIPTSQPAPADPWEEWQQFAQSGTLGKLVAHTQPAVRSSSQPTVTRQSGTTTIGPARTVSPGTSSQQPVVRVTPTSSTTQPANTSLGTYVNGYTPIPGMRHPTTQTIPIGTTATATITTPILWPGDGNQVTNSRAPDAPKYIVTLDEPLMTANQRIVFPKAAQLVVSVTPIDTHSGVATLDVLAILRADRSYTIPPGQLHIRGEDGNPLVAQRFHDPGGTIFSMDAGLFIISGLANLGTILNRPRSSTIVNSDFQGTVANEYDDPNFIGAVLEGGAGALAERLAERNEQAIEELANRPSTWYLPTGTEVQLFVNQPIRI